MTNPFRLLGVALLALALGAMFVLAGGRAAAAPGFTVSISPSQPSFAAGANGVFVVRVAGPDADMPALDFDAAGGDITGIVSLNRVGPSAAEGAVWVSRATPGSVTLTAGFAGATLATGEAHFVQTGSVQVNVALEGADRGAAARTWRFEVVNASGNVVQTLNVGTSGDDLSASASTAQLPYGFYTVRQVLGNDTKFSCAGGAFYAVTAPGSGQTTLELRGASAAADFTIAVCAGMPRLSVDIPIDTLAPAAGVVGEAYPGETPINEVRGARSEGPGNPPLPPKTGSGAGNRSAPPLPVRPFLATIGIVLLVAPLSVLAVRLSNRRKR